MSDFAKRFVPTLILPAVMLWLYAFKPLDYVDAFIFSWFSLLYMSSKFNIPLRNFYIHVIVNAAAVFILIRMELMPAKDYQSYSLTEMIIRCFAKSALLSSGILVNLAYDWASQFLLRRWRDR